MRSRLSWRGLDEGREGAPCATSCARGRRPSAPGTPQACRAKLGCVGGEGHPTGHQPSPPRPLRSHSMGMGHGMDASMPHISHDFMTQQ